MGEGAGRMRKDESGGFPLAGIRRQGFTVDGKPTNRDLKGPCGARPQIVHFEGDHGCAAHFRFAGNGAVGRHREVISPAALERVEKYCRNVGFRIGRASFVQFMKATVRTLEDEVLDRGGTAF